MIQSLFRLLVRPRVTLDELLEERRQGRSIGATLLLMLLNVLVFVILLVFVAHKVMAHLTEYLTESDGMSPDEIRFLEIFVIGMVVLVSLVSFCLSRPVFSWIVRLGVRISAGRQYPRDKDERREKARLLRLVHPYTLWISMLPSWLSLIVLALMVGFADVPNFDHPNASDIAHLTRLLAYLILWNCLSQLFQFGMWIYMIVVRTFAIQKIYRISGARAFWGPFLIYALLYFVLFVLYTLMVVMIQLNGGGSPTPDLNWM